MENVKKERIASIDLMRLVFAVMVISIHALPFSEINVTLCYFITQTLPRLAVPFFYCTIGYFYIQKLLDGKAVFLKTFKKYLTIYIFWSVVYFLYETAAFVVKGDKTLPVFLKSLVVKFFFRGSSPHLWFFPAVFFSLIVITLCFRFKLLKPLAVLSLVLYTVGLLGSSYYAVGNSIPLLSPLVNFSEFSLFRGVVCTGLPYMMMGYLLNLFMKNFKKNNKKYIALGIVFLLLFLAEIVFVVYFRLQKNVMVTVMMYPLLFITMVLLLSNPMSGLQKLSQTTRDMANFIYYFHMLLLNILNFIAETLNLAPMNTLIFLITTVISALLGYILHKMDNKYLNRIYK